MIKKAGMADVKELHSYLQKAAKTGEILPRPINDLYRFLRDYWIRRSRKGAPISAVSSFHICWDNLGEIRNLFVDPDLRSRGIGEKMVKLALDEAKSLGVRRIFALTYRTGFFERLGFRQVDKQRLPSKVWVDCIHCVKFPDCDEIAVIFDRKKDKFRQPKTKGGKK